MVLENKFKINIIILVILILILIIFTSCILNSNETEQPHETEKIIDEQKDIELELELKNKKQSDCVVKYQDANDSESKEFEIIVDNNILSVKHYEAFYNCNAEINYSIEKHDNDIILYEENKTKTSINCMCYFNLSVDIFNLTSGTYNLIIMDKNKTEIMNETEITIE